MALRLYRANRVENLLEQQLNVMREPLGDPLKPESLMVQNPGMATWLRRKLADRFGICAGVEFLFPRQVIGRAFSSVLGDEAYGVHAYDPSRLVWAILAQLPALLERPEFSTLRYYLYGDRGDRKRIQLARRIADVFDQYALYRPEMVLAWDAGTEKDWQAQLWREIAVHLGTGHIAALTQKFTRLAQSLPELEGFPKRLCCFGISTLPPLYIHVLQLLATHVDVHFFLLQPSQEFMGDIRSRGEIDRVLARRPDHTEDTLALTEGHPLLASMGRMGRDFQDLLLSQTQFHDQGFFANPEGRRMLDVLQHDMLHLIHRGVGEHHPIPLNPEDRSISIHSCHGPMREVEVLRDQLLSLFDQHTDLSPGDVVVMMPDVETYAPLIEAAFGAGGDKHLPFSIADRNFRGASPAIDAFFRVLDLQQSRATASELLDLLALEPVHRRYNIKSEEMETLVDWVTHGGIRWGIDANHRAVFDQPKQNQNTWQFGLQRLLLGYAMPEEDQVYEGVLARDQVEGIEAQLLGRFSHFSTTLFQLMRMLRGKRTIVAWQKILLRVLDALVAADGESEWQHQQIRVALDNLVSDAGDGGFEKELELTAVRSLLEDRIEYENEGWNFMAEGITFCAMVPMRSIPFRVVAMLGMDDRAFPRSRRPENFDKIAEKPRTGDRSKRNEERYLFLEGILAAREYLIISFVGQDIKDNALLPPSVVVSELIDCLSEGFVLPGGTAGDRDGMVERLVLKHPMQGFNPLYFDPTRRPELFSYSESHFQGAQGYVSRQSTTYPLFTESFGALDKPDQLPLEELIRFICKPVAYMMKHRLGFTFEDKERHLSDREPMDLTRLDRYRAGSELLDRLVSGLDGDAVMTLARAEGSLPLGTPGDIRFQELHRELAPLLHTVRHWTSNPLPPLNVEVGLDGLTLHGRLHNRYDRGLLWYQYKRLGGKHLLTSWIRHLAMCATQPEDQQHTSVWVGRGKEGATVTATFGPVASPEAHLADLVDLYQTGLQEPLLFFPKSALAFMRAEDETKGMRAAHNTWRNREFSENGEQPYPRAFGDMDVLAPGFSLFCDPMMAGDFPTLAKRVFTPLLAHLEEEVCGAAV